MASSSDISTLCILGTGNLGLSILKSIVNQPTASDEASSLPFTKYIACVRSEKSASRVHSTVKKNNESLSISQGENVAAVAQSQVVILSVDPADVEHVLSQKHMASAMSGKLLISVAAGWTTSQLEELVAAKKNNICVVRTLPNIAAQVGEALTAIEEPQPEFPQHYLQLTEAIFGRIGKTSRVPERLMDAVTAVGGSTPAFFGVICDALVDAAVAVGLPRDIATSMIVQSMKGSAEMMQGGGLSPSQLRDQGTSPEGCTIGGLMVLEQAGVRGHIGKALREAVTVARLMGKVPHVNDTRHA